MPLDVLPRYAQLMFVRLEDNTFYQHPGVELRARRPLAERGDRHLHRPRIERVRGRRVVVEHADHAQRVLGASKS